MPIRSTVATPPHIIRYSDGSEWALRAVKDDTDDEEIQKLVTVTVTNRISPKELRRAKREHRIDELVMENINQETRMSVKRATLFHMTDYWKGPEFTIPTDYVQGEEFKKAEKDESGKHVPHALAGQLAPVAPEWVGVRDSDELDEILEVMEDIWAGRTEEEETMFPRTDERLVEQPARKRRPTA